MPNKVDSLLFNVAKNGYEGSSPVGYKGIKIVKSLPKFGESGFVYKVPKAVVEGSNLFNEYVWTGIEFKLFMENVDPAVESPEVEVTSKKIDALEARVKALETAGKDAYQVFKDDIKNAPSGSKVILGGDIDGSGIQNIIDKDLTVDLGGHSIKCSTPAIFYVTEKGSLTIDDSLGTGSITYTANSNDAAIYVDTGTLTINSGSITGGGSSIGGAILIRQGGTVIVNGGVITGTTGAINSNNTLGSANIIVNGGVLDSKIGAAIYHPDQGIIEVNGGKITGINLRMGQLTVNGGEINATMNEEKIDDPKDTYDISGNVWLPDAIASLAGTYNFKDEKYGNSLHIVVNGGKISAENGKGSAIGIYDLGKVQQEVTLKVSDKAVLTTNAPDRHAVDVLTLVDVGVTNPKAGYSIYSGHVQIGG